MDIGISTACFYPMATEDTIPVVADLGFKKIEVFMEANSEYEEDFCKSLREDIERHHLKVVSVHAFCSAFEPFLYSNYKRRKDDSIGLLAKALSAAQILGAKYYTFHGNRKEATGKDFDFYSFGKDMDMFSEMAAERGVVLAWENVCWCQSWNPQFIANALEHIQSENLKFTLDVKQALRAGIPPEQYMQVMGERIVNVHINDADEGHDCLLPGEGSVDLASLIRNLRNQGYDGDYIIEVYRSNFMTSEQVKFSRKYLQNIIDVIK